MSYAILHTDTSWSAKAKSFNTYEELRKFLVSEVIAADPRDMNLGELTSIYNIQNGETLEVCPAAYINNKGEVVYYS